MSRNRLPCLPALAGLALLLLPSAVAAQSPPPGTIPNVVPSLSKLFAQSQMGTPLITVNQLDSQGSTLDALAAAVQQTGGVSGTLTHDIWGSASFSSVRSGTVDLSYTRADTKQFGTGVIFGGQVYFRYEFSVDVPSVVTVDYDVIGTEDNPGDSWFAMQGFRVDVRGQLQDVNFSLMFLIPPKPFAPQDFQGSFSFPIPAGTCWLQISDSASASGNQYQSVRTMVGRFGWRIGPPEELPDLGFGLAGTHGVPALTASGSLIGGSPLSVHLGNALELGSAAMVLGLSTAYAPVKGGVLVPNPDVLVFGIPLDGAGELALESTWPLGLPPGLASYAQFWLADPAGVQGYAASNAVAFVVP